MTTSTRNATGRGTHLASRRNQQTLAARRSRPTLPAVEAVEPRRLLSASASGGVLTVTGTEFGDNILVSSSGGQIFVTRNNNAEGSFSGITSIVVNALGGDDQITIRPDGQ